MEADLVNDLHAAITPLEAQEILNWFKIGDFAHMDKKNRQETHKKIYNLAFPKEKKKMSLDDLERAIRNG